jgi:predicted O-linked N-acetylglucosamine transferase (SPINDLY family)
MSSSNVTQAKLSLAIEAHRRGNLDLAEKLYREILSQNPNEPDAIHLLGVIAIQAEQFPSAIALIEQAIAMNPKAEYYGNLGVAFEKMDRLDESQRAYEKAVEIKPEYVEALLNLGVVLSKRNDFAKAIASYVTATQLAPYSFEAWHNLGIAYSEADNDQSALSAYEHAAQLNPINSNVFANMGLVFIKQGKLAEAKIAFEKAVQLDASHVQANKQLAIIFRSQQQSSEAIRHARQALLSSNDDLECKLLLISLLQQTHAWDELTGTLNPQVIANQMLEMTTRTSRNSHETSEAFGTHPASQMLPLVSPLSILSLPCEVAPHVNLAFAKRWAASQSIGQMAGRRGPAQANVHRKLRIGYLSADFRAHPVGYCLAELIESHDRDRFEVFAYSNGHDDGSEIRQRLVKAFDQWRELSHLSVQASAEQIRSDEIDILVDLQGYTEGARTPILSLRPAPIQVNYLGFPGTMGANFIDYILVDEYVSPKENRNVFQETPIYLPGCYLPRDSQRTMVTMPRTRADEGLPEHSFVFCAFSSPHKITEEVFDCWLRILSQVPQCVLWLRSSNALADNSLRARAKQKGTEANRLVFAPIVSMHEHLGRQRLADLFLDTFPYNQHSTAQDALAMGVPLLTISGENFPSRVAGSLLASLELPELIATTLREYESKAIELVQNVGYRKAIQERLEVALASGKLPDGKSSARKLESAFVTMIEQIYSKTDNSRSMLERAFQLHNVQDYSGAEALYRQFLILDQNCSEVLEALGILLVQTERVTEGIDYLMRATLAAPNVAQRHFNLGLALNTNRQPDQAIEAWKTAVQLDPSYRDAWNELGRVYMQCQRCEDAKLALEYSLRLSPDQIEKQCDLADVCFELLRLEEAKSHYHAVLKSAPNHVRSLNNLANIYKLEGRFLEAARLYDRAIQFEPNNASLYQNIANVFVPLNFADKALVAYQRAIHLNPQYVDAWIGLGSLFTRMQQLTKSLECFEKAYELDSENLSVLEKLIKSKQLLCDWNSIEQLEKKLLQFFDSNPTKGTRGILQPFTTLGLCKPTTREQQLIAAKRYSDWLRNSIGSPKPRFRNKPNDRHVLSNAKRCLRIGYVTADFRAHPVGMAISHVVENHDRQKFEVFAYSYGPDDGSVWRKQIENGVDHFVDIQNWSIESSVKRIVDDQIDILIDLQGHIGDPRPEIFIHRPAPIQAHYLGYPGTSGADYIDYDIVDEYVVPRDHRESFSEKIVYLPGCLLTNNAQTDRIEVPQDRASLGLPENTFVFCAFHNAFKLNPTMIDVWAKLLRETPRSILWLQEGDLTTMDNIKREFAQREVSRDRLLFAPRVSSSLHIARQRFADLFLDAFPYNAHTTACDTLRMNLPIVTLSGETIASRIAGSVLHSLDLDELITQTHDDYFQVAVRLATQPDALKGVREKLSRSLATTELYDGLAFARKLESAYQAMWQSYQHGNPLRHIDLTSPGS